MTSDNSRSTRGSVLYIGGTGTISASAVRRSVEVGMDVTVLNRGRNTGQRSLPDEVTTVIGDITDPSSVEAALSDQHFDSVVNFFSFTPQQAESAVKLFDGRTDQYVHISTASMYRKPVLQLPIVESTLRSNPFVKYAREKIAAEDALMEAFATRGFPVTIVRPSHTYDEGKPPLPGGWTMIERMARGDEVVVTGDGTSLWTVTHAADLAVGLVGLLGNSSAIGEAFHITSDDVRTWDQIYTILGKALGVTPRLVHVPSEFLSLAAPGWLWSELLEGDLSHSAVFDNSKIRRYVPEFAPEVTFERAAPRIIAWREEHPEAAAADPEADAIFDRLAEGYNRSREIFASLAPEGTNE